MRSQRRPPDCSAFQNGARQLRRRSAFHDSRGVERAGRYRRRAAASASAAHEQSPTGVDGSRHNNGTDETYTSCAGPAVSSRMLRSYAACLENRAVHSCFFFLDKAPRVTETAFAKTPWLFCSSSPDVGYSKPVR